MMARNISASFLANVYAAIISIVAIPAYIFLLGPDRYGLVGVYLIIQPIISLLDLGFGVTAMRESARVRGSAIDAQQFRDVIDGLQLLFWTIFVLVTGAAILFSETFVLGWLRVPPLLQQEAITATQLMAVSLMMRWLCIIYRGCITGFEDLTWLATISAVAATLRFLVVIPVLWLLGGDLRIFFAVQIIAVLIELSLFARRAFALFPERREAFDFVRARTALAGVIGFTAAVSAGGLIWILGSQVDKVMLMRRLTIADYGVFSVAVILAGGISVIATPINQALLPRLSHLHARRENAALMQIYRDCTQLTAVLAGSAAVFLIVFAREILANWAGLGERAMDTAIILQFYAAGSCALAFAIFNHYLQIATRLSKIYTLGIGIYAAMFALLCALLIPRYGALGGAVSWLGVNLYYLFAWTPFVHRELAPGLNWRWFATDILPSVTAAAATALVFKLLLPASQTWWIAQASLVLVGAMVLAAACLASPLVRGRLPSIVNRLTHFASGKS